MTLSNFQILVQEINKLGGKLTPFEIKVVDCVLRSRCVRPGQGKVIEAAYRRAAGGHQWQKKEIIR
jgi:hypothetical protein